MQFWNGWGWFFFNTDIKCTSTSFNHPSWHVQLISHYFTNYTCQYCFCVFSVLQHQADEACPDSPVTSNQSQSQIQPLLYRLQQLTSEHQSAQTQLCLAQDREREANEKVQRWVQTCALLVTRFIYI